jgi:hypothetical protein
VRAGDITIVREGSGTGEGRALIPAQAHELALKGAETDATKRALATFGNPFGLALYDRKQVGVSRRGGAKAKPATPSILRSSSGTKCASFEKPGEFAAALRKAMTEAEDIEILFAIWEKNVDTVRALNRRLKQDHLPNSGVAPQLVAHFKRCAIALVKSPPDSSHEAEDAPSIPRQFNRRPRPKIDKSVLTIAEPKRIRCKEHLRYVASQPCLICGRLPSQAHHVRYAQSRGIGLKVSDEFTVPLCAIHHNHVHTTGKEQEWWQKQNIDPLIVARALWQESHEQHPTEKEGPLAGSSEAVVSHGPTLPPQ